MSSDVAFSSFLNMLVFSAQRWAKPGKTDKRMNRVHNLMQHWPLLVGRIIDHAARYHPKREIISRDVDGQIRTSTWSDVHLGARKVTQALRRMGIKKGDVVGVMAWNTRRMMDVWYGVPGAGAVLHTLNPRLFADQLAYVINHAENTLILLSLIHI